MLSLFTHQRGLKRIASVSLLIPFICLSVGNGWGKIDRADVSFTEAQALWGQRNWDDSVLAYEAYLHKYPEGPFAVQAYMNLGKYLESYNRFDEALTFYEMGLENAQGRLAEEIKTEIAAVHGAMRNYDQAIEIYQNLLVNTREWDIFKLANRNLKSAIRFIAYQNQVTQSLNRCAEESLTVILNQFGISPSRDILTIQLKNKTKKGISLNSLAQAAIAHGVTCKGVKVEGRDPELVQSPAILLFHPGHYVVFQGVSNQGVKILDPSLKGLEKMVLSRKAFMNRWTGYALSFNAESGKDNGLTYLSQSEMETLFGGDHPDHPGFASTIGALPNTISDDPPSIFVNTSSLNLMVRDVDGLWKNRGPTIILKRTYNSDDSNTGMFGNSWHFQYEVFLTESPDGTIALTKGDGGWNIFERNLDGTYRSREGYIHDKLEKMDDGTHTLLKKATKNTYFFDTEGKLSSISDRSENSITFQYEATNIPEIWGELGNNDGQFYKILGIAVDSSGNVYVVDRDNERIQKFDSNGNFVTKWGSEGSGDGEFDWPHSIAVDSSGNVYVTEDSQVYPSNNRVQKFDSNGNFIAKWGARGSADGEFDYPNGIAVDGTGNVYVADGGNERIQKFDSNGNFITKWGTRGTDDGEFDDPYGVAVDNNGNIYVTDYRANRVQKFDSNGNFITKWGSKGSGDGQFDRPTGIAVDTSGYVYVADIGNDRVQKFDGSGNFVCKWGRTGLGGGQFINPVGVAVNSTGYVYVTDGYAGLGGAMYRVQKFKSNLPIGTFLSTITDPHGRIISFAYGQNGKVASLLDPIGREATFMYDSAGNLIRSNDYAGNQTEYTYDVQGYMNSITTSSGTSQIIYEFFSDLGITYIPKTIIDPIGNRRNYQVIDGYLCVTNAEGMTTAYIPESYKIFTSKKIDDVQIINGDPPGLDISGGLETYFEYDLYGNLSEVTIPDGTITDFDGDSSGNMTGITNSLGNKVSFQYDGSNNFVKMVNAAGKELNFTYNDQNILIKATDPGGNSVGLGYDSYGQLQILTDARGNRTTFSYDNYGNLTSSEDSLGQTAAYVYDTAGRPTMKTDPNGRITSYSYDELDRLILVSYPDGIITYNYEGWNLASVTNKNRTTTTLQYDALDRLVQFEDENGLSIQYGYDSSGNLLSITYPGNKIVNYTYDKFNRLIGVKDWLNNTTSYQYDNVGNLLSVLYSNGTKISYSYDTGGRLTSLANKKSDGKIISKYSFTLDTQGMIVSKTGQQPLYPVLSNSNINYSYDQNNRLTTANSTSFQYDSDGNMITKTDGTKTTSFSYDYENRLAQILPETQNTQYEYDAFGNRISKTVNGIKTQYLNHINDYTPWVLAEIDNSGIVICYYIYGVGLVSKITSDGHVFYYHYDSVGSTVAMSDSSENLVNTYAYSPFGKVTKSRETIANPFKYAGRYGVMDEGNGLLYMRARYYDPEIGRFINKDPIGFHAGMNFYEYCNNNPIMYVDITGLDIDRVGEIYSGHYEAINDVLGTASNYVPGSAGELVGLASSLASSFGSAATGNFNVYETTLGMAGGKAGGVIATSLIIPSLGVAGLPGLAIGGTAALAGGFLGSKLGGAIDRPFNNILGGLGEAADILNNAPY